MTRHAPPSPAAPGADPGRQVAQLGEALRLVRRIAGQPETGARESLLDEAARLSEAYDRAPPILQRRFDALATETAVWTAAGVEALLAAGAAPPTAAAGRLALRLEQALSDLADLVRPAPLR